MRNLTNTETSGVHRAITAFHLRVWKWCVCPPKSAQNRQKPTGSKDKTARVWNLRTGELETTLEHPGEVTDVCPLVRPDGKLVLVAASLDKVHVWPMVHPSVVGVQPSILRLSHGV